MTDVLEITYPDSILVTPDEMEVLEIGYVSGGFIPVPGPEGPKGDKGDKGDPGEVVEYEVQFASPALQWVTSHSLGRDPIVVTVDLEGNEITGDVRTTETTIHVGWAVPVAGTLRYY